MFYKKKKKKFEYHIISKHGLIKSDISFIGCSLKIIYVNDFDKQVVTLTLVSLSLPVKLIRQNQP